MPDKRILIIVNMAKPGVAERVESLRHWFAEHAEVVGVIDVPGDEDLAAIKADLCIVFGGDGSLLASARRVAPTGIPMMGVNMGKLGFLADFSVKQMQEHLDAILDGKVQPVERMMLQVGLVGGKVAFSSLATNDVVISAGAPFRMIELCVNRGEDRIATFMGDGVVVATPTGSTGYNLSAGGPILEPSLKAMVITPVAPHTLAMRPVVVGGDATIRITADRLNPGTTLVIDGQVSAPIQACQAVEIRRAAWAARIVSNPGGTFFRTLIDKLHWGRSPHHKEVPGTRN